MRILIFNWRDIKNPSSGGAEILTHEIAKRLVTKRHEVTFFTSKFPNSKTNEIVDGVRIVRNGHPDARFIFQSVHFKAYQFYKTEHNKKPFDFVIDEVHGLPFFTPWYVKSKKILLVCEVAGPLWEKMFGQFFGTIGRIAEIFYLKFVYLHVPFLAISESTKKSLISNGIKQDNIYVLPMGISIPFGITTYKKEIIPTIIFVARLTKPKGIEDAIITTKLLTEQIKDIQLWVVGRGSETYLEELERLVKMYNIEKQVTFFNFVSENKKFELMNKANILIHPSVHEGFGLTIPEAGYVGTPTVAYNSLGIRDIIKSNVNGILVKENTPKELAKEILQLLRNKSEYAKITNRMKQDAKLYSWEKTTNYILELLATI